MARWREYQWAFWGGIIVAVVGLIGTLGVALINRNPDPSPPPPRTVRVWGSVLAAEDRAALAGARVRIQSSSGLPEVLTDADGVFHFDLPESDAKAKVLIRVEAAGFAPQLKPVVPANSSLVEFLLVPQVASRYLVDLTPSSSTAGIGRVEGNVLSMDPPPGAGAAAEYAIPQDAQVFHGRVRLANEGTSCTGNARARVLLDGKPSGDYNIRGQEVRSFDIPLEPRKHALRLEADDAGEPSPCDRVLWIDARFEGVQPGGKP